MSDALPPARPHLRFTDDGRRVREVLSYSRRGNRLHPVGSRRPGTRTTRSWVIPDDAVDDARLLAADWFGREAPLIVEIGSGIGEATAALAAQRPESDVLAFEVWRPGVAQTLGLLDEAGADNVRLLSVDAVWSLEHLFAPGRCRGAVDVLPRPVAEDSGTTSAGWSRRRSPRWPRRRLRPGGLWRLATDWQEYAEQMRAVLDAEPLSGGVVDRWADRPLTRFERKGRAVDRQIVDLRYVR